MLWKTLGLKKDTFRKYVVCKKCFCLYSYDDCVNVVEGQEMSASCSQVQYPNHTQQARRKACGQQLLKQVSLSNGTSKLYPYKVYSYKPIVIYGVLLNLPRSERFMLKMSF